MVALSLPSLVRQACALAMLAAALALTACASSGPPTGLLDSVGAVDLGPRPPTPTEHPSQPPPQGGGRAKYEYYPAPEAGAEEPKGRQYAQAENGVTPSGEGYDINLEEAQIGDVVRMILGDVLKKTYFIDPRVTGTITLSTGRPVTETELLRVLELALQLNDAILSQDGDRYVVTTGGEAFEGSGIGNVDFGRDGGPKPPGFGLTVLPLRHVRAQNIVELIDSYATPAGSVRAIVRNNMVLMRGTAAEREALRDIILAFDVDWMRSQSAAIATLTNSAPEEIIPELEAIFLSSTEGEDKMLVRFTALQHLNGVLIIGSDKGRVREAMEWVSRLDRQGAEATNYYVYRVQNGKAVDIAKILSNTFGTGEGAGAAAPEREVAPDQAATQVGTQPAQPQQQVARTGLGEQDPDAATPSKLADTSGVVTYTLAADTRITASATNNTLVIRAPPRQYRKILTVLRQIDSPALQVLINTMIAEVTLNDNLRYGVQAFLKSNDVSLALFTGGVPAIAPLAPGLNFLVGSRKDPSVIVDALSRVTSVRVVSSPSVVVLDNQQAVIKVGDQVPIRTQELTPIESDNIINSFEYRDTGVILRVTPRVSGTGLVTMEISQELLDTQPGEGAGGNPTFSQRVINSTVSVYSRQTVVLGGLIAGEEERDKIGVPVIDHIPIIGDLLGKTDNRRRRSELIVFITPHVIRDALEASQVSEEVRAKLRLLADPRQNIIVKP